jgi:sorbitol-specific phosphotransferase system component IIA
MLPRVSVITFLLLVILAAGRAPAMDILFFSRMNLDDQATYVTALIEGAAQMLREQGHPDQAQRVIDLFKDKSPNGGVHQMAYNLKHLEEENVHNGDNPNSRAQVYDVEAAMEQTLQDAGIRVPLPYLETINRHFTPFYPLTH